MSLSPAYRPDSHSAATFLLLPSQAPYSDPLSSRGASLRPALVSAGDMSALEKVENSAFKRERAGAAPPDATTRPPVHRRLCFAHASPLAIRACKVGAAPRPGARVTLEYTPGRVACCRARWFHPSSDDSCVVQSPQGATTAPGPPRCSARTTSTPRRRARHPLAPAPALLCRSSRRRSDCAATDLCPSSPPPPPAPFSQLEAQRAELFEEGLRQYKEKKFDDAIITFENVVGLEPKKYIGDNMEKARTGFGRPLGYER